MKKHQQRRRAKVIERLQTQLDRGVKVLKNSSPGQIKVETAPLTDSDKTRIKKEIQTLEARV